MEDKPSNPAQNQGVEENHPSCTSHYGSQMYFLSCSTVLMVAVFPSHDSNAQVVENDCLFDGMKAENTESWQRNEVELERFEDP